MKMGAWIVCGLWIAVAIGIAGVRGVSAVRSGRARLATRRLKSPTVYLFAAYLLVAALVVPMSAGESTSPLLWLAIALPIAFVGSAFASAAEDRPRAWARVALALLFGGAVLATSAVILAIVSPAFVPMWLR